MGGGGGCISQCPLWLQFIYFVELSVVCLTMAVKTMRTFWSLSDDLDQKIGNK